MQREEKDKSWRKTREIKREREIVRGRNREKEGIGESEAGNETVLGQS